MLKIAFRAMGCEMSALIDSESDRAARLLEQVPGWFEVWEQSLSRFRPDSTLNRLNASPGLPFAVDDTLWTVLRAALDAARWTKGLVTPAVLPDVERAGYVRSFDQMPAGASAEPFPAPWEEQQLDAAAAAPDPSAADLRRVRLDPRRRTVLLPDGMRLDLGGIAKGWAACEAAFRLSAVGPALVDGGGDLAASGPMAGGEPWPIAVADPTGAQEELVMLALPGGGAATSGIDYRRWLRGGKWQHHIIDPRTGRPASTDLLSATVLSADPLLAEAAAKTVMILGSRAGMAWLEKHPALRGLLVLRDGGMLYGPGFSDCLWREA